MVLVTGATGHIGNTLVRALLGRGEKVRVFVRTGRAPSIEGLNVAKTVGDILDYQALVKAFKGCERVYHIAGIIAIDSGRSEHLHRVNVQGTHNVVRACFEAGVKRLVYTGSIHAFGTAERGTVISEKSRYQPENTIGGYGHSKALATLEVLDGIKAGLDAVIVCPSACVGPNDYKPSKIGKFLLDFLHGRIICYVDGAFDFVDVRDVAEGHILAGNKGHTGESYLLCGKNIAISELLDLLQDVSGLRVAKIKVPVMLARIASVFMPLYSRITKREARLTKYTIQTLTGKQLYNAAATRKELGLSPRPLKESLRDTLQWLRQYYGPSSSPRP